MLAKVHSTACLGIDAYPVEIEVDVAHGLPSVTMVGLPDQVVKESKERVRTAIRNSGFELPPQRVTINLAPANTRKEGPSFDLAIAIGWLAASGFVKEESLRSFVFQGELALDGTLKAARGVLASAFKVAEHKQTLVIPDANVEEASLSADASIEYASSLKDVVARLNGERSLPLVRHTPADISDPNCYENDWQDVRGQTAAKRAFEVAASGGHNILLIGSPGAGKTLMAKCLPSIMPASSLDEILTITRIYSISHTGVQNGNFLKSRPFRAPHHSISTAGLIGGGSYPRPGEISLAHGGVLFLDEFTEFRRDTLEALRGPLEDGYVQISRARSGVFLPSQFMLVAAMNPCPCGFLFDRHKKCRCTMNQIQRYHARVSGPILDRIDIHLEVPAVPHQELSKTQNVEKSETIRARVAQARAIQQKRYEGKSFFTNATLPSRFIREYCRMTASAEKLLNQIMETLHLSARAYHRILKLAQTIADMSACSIIEERHIAEAVQYRSLDRRLHGA